MNQKQLNIVHLSKYVNEAPANAPGQILAPSGDPVSSSVLPQDLKRMGDKWRGKPRLRTEADLQKAMPPVFLAGLLRKTELLMLSGAAKSRKSFVALELLVRNELAALYPDIPQYWMGRQIHPTFMVYINFELTEEQFDKRLRKMFQALDSTGQLWALELDLVHTATIHLKGVHPMTPDLMCSFLRSLRVPNPLTGETLCPQDPGVIIVDPMYCVSSAENEITEVVSFLQKIQSVGMELRAAVICLHHFAKGNSALKEQIDRHSGSGGYARFFDVLACITGMELEDHMEFEATVRDFAPLPKTAWRWQFPFYVRDEAADGLALRGQKGKLTVADTMLVETLKELFEHQKDPDGPGVSTKAWKGAISEKFGMVHGTAANKITQIWEGGEFGILRHKKGREIFWKPAPME
jgi:hypothetical protein